jgi:hypothetical protein
MMRAYTERKRHAATVLATAYHNPEGLAKLFPTDLAAERPATEWWWQDAS